LPQNVVFSVPNVVFQAEIFWTKKYFSQAKNFYFPTHNNKKNQLEPIVTVVVGIARNVAAVSYGDAFGEKFSHCERKFSRLIAASRRH